MPGRRRSLRADLPRGFETEALIRLGNGGGALVGASNARGAVVDALDDWPIPRFDPISRHRRSGVLQVARLSTGEESAWRSETPATPKCRRSKQGPRTADRADSSTDAESLEALLLRGSPRISRSDRRRPGPPPDAGQARAQPGDFWAGPRARLGPGPRGGGMRMRSATSRPRCRSGRRRHRLQQPGPLPGGLRRAGRRRRLLPDRPCGSTRRPPCRATTWEWC